MTPAFIIGNGLSRAGLDLEKLRGIGSIFGCNALHRDFRPDYLIAIDDHMIAEVLQSSFPVHRLLVPPLDECFEPAEVNPDRPRSNAGMIAMAEAIKRGHGKLYCLGFDFILTEPEQFMSNVYEGTPCYGLDTRANEEDTLNRVRFLRWFVRKYRTNDFYFVFPRGAYDFHDIYSDNVKLVYQDDFERELDKCRTSAAKTAVA